MRKTTYAVSLALAVVAAAAVAIAATSTPAPPASAEACPAPEGWLLTGTAAAQYTACRVPRGDGLGSACRLASDTAATTGFGTVMQSIDATNYAGKRVRLSASVRTEDVAGWAGVWMRIDRQGGNQGAFDNMYNRPLKGTLPWARHDVVLDVAPDASGIAFGVLLGGRGSAWIDDIKIEVVSNDVPTTDMMGGGDGMTVATNLDFEK